MATEERYFVHRLNDDSAKADPVVLREKQTVRLVFNPLLVRNQQDASKPLSGEFVYQKKKAANDWEDELTKNIYSIEAGTGYKIALDRSETDKLYRHLSSLYGHYRKNGIPARTTEVPVPDVEVVDGGSAILLRSLIEKSGHEAFAELLEFATNATDFRQTLKEIERLEANNLQKIISIAGIGTVKQCLDIWRQEMQNSSEPFWQSHFEKFPFLFSQVFASPIVILQEKPYAGGKGIENIGGKYPDFLMKNLSMNNVLIVEIKTPVTSLIGKVYRKPNIFPPSDELTGAISQVIRYKDTLIKDFYSLNYHSKSKFNALSPRCLVVAGNSRELDEEGKRESFELFKNSIRDVDVITYDELFAKSQQLVNLLEGVYEPLPPF